MPMKLYESLIGTPIPMRAKLTNNKHTPCSNLRSAPFFGSYGLGFLVCLGNSRPPIHSLAAAANSSSPFIPSNVGSDSTLFDKSPGKLEALEENIERAIYRCRFMAILGVFGSLIGSFLCFIKGCTFVVDSFKNYLIIRSKVILTLIEAIDVYLLGTVMLVFGMGLYELFVSHLDSVATSVDENASQGSNLFGLFTLKERPKWLGIKTVDELKTKLGHVIVMLLLIGFFDKSKKAAIHSPLDLLCFCASVLLSSSCLFLLSKLHD